MTTQIPVETISLVVFKNTPVITTELLTQLYGTDVDNIKKNYSRNAGRFCEGKHFFKITGEELKNLRVTLSHSQNPISPKARTLTLWTERGAARHAKMLETDQAWEVFEKLEDCYFNKKISTQFPIQNTTQQAMVIEDCAITQLNALFFCAEHLRTSMWPHLSKLFPGLNKSFFSTFETLSMATSLLKETREDCRLKAEEIMARR